MYTVTVVAVNEVIEVKVEAKCCTVDDDNNLVFYDKVRPGKPVAMFPASRWIAVVQQ